MSRLDLAAIKARVEGATPGGWTRCDRVFLSGDDIVFGMSGFDNSDFIPKQDERNADFIAHARTDVPALVARVEELEPLIEGLLDLCGRTQDFWNEDDWETVKRARATFSDEDPDA